MWTIGLIITTLLIAVILPLRAKKRKDRDKNIRFYNIDTDTSNSTYAVNEFGLLEKIGQINSHDQTEIEL